MTIRPAVLWVLALSWSALLGSSGGFPLRGWIPVAHSAVIVPATVIGALLFSCAVVVSFANSVMRPTMTMRSIVEAAGSLTAFCVVVAALIFTEGQHAKLIAAIRVHPFLESGLESEKLEQKLDGLSAERGRLLASLIYRESGLRLSHRSEDGAAILFEPNADDERHRAEERDSRRTRREFRKHLEWQSETLRRAALFHVAALPCVAFAYLSMLRKRGASVTP